MTVTLSNGATITIADGATSGTTTVPASDDVYVGGDTASKRLSLMQRAATSRAW
ncbi:hypothetical protein ITG10_00015 [Vibrio sp. ED004]|uniref:immunoglobulin-like domain-containing protein n=1 Tax=Vibrio sp. ED004 TaxID=2785124 RepID=UPI00206B4D99|nr:immunoglobulin-like domain-containing protein [Vibrio sp. ED004]UPR56802.1 hypothetical protein ITG10_00015 [Vibrio sp. ED004]